MKTRLLISMIATGLLTACAETTVKKVEDPEPEPLKTQYIPEQKPDMAILSMSGPLNYGYKIYGDPIAAPSQVFSDDKYLYMQLNKGQTPPIPTTRDGKIVEYEVRRGFVIMPKVDSVILRLGPRKAYIDEKNTEIVRYESSSLKVREQDSIIVDVTSPEPPKPVLPKKKESSESVVGELNIPSQYRFSLDKVIKARTLSDLGIANQSQSKWRICTPPFTRGFKAGQKLELVLNKAGWSSKLDPECTSKTNDIVMEKI